MGGEGHIVTGGADEGEGGRGGVETINSLNKYDVLHNLLNELPPINQFNDVKISSQFHDFNSLTHNFKNSNKPLFISLNIQSLNSKFEKLSLLIKSLSNKGVTIDIIALQETWQIKDVNLFSLPGYQPLVYKNRSKGRGGGIGFYIKNGLNFKIIDKLSPFKDKLFESLTLEISQQHNNITKHYLASSIYRSPSQIANTSHSQQLEDFTLRFDNLLHDLNTKNCDSFIFMDSNINLLNLDTNQPAKNFLHAFTERGYLLANLKATRIQGDHFSLIDNILTNSKTNSLQSGSLIDNISDHLITFIQPSLSKQKTKPKIVKSRKFDTNNVNALKQALSTLTWQNVLHCTDVDNCYNTFWAEFVSLFDIYIPETEKKFNKNFHKISDFMTGGLLNSRRTKLSLQKKSIIDPSPVNVNHYKQYRNLFNSLVRASKKLHYAKKLNENAKNPKKLWETLNELTTGNNKPSSVDKILANGKVISDKMGMAEEFNKFFTEAGTKISESIQPVINPPDNFPSAECPDLVLNTISQLELIEIINSLAPKTSTDIHGISMKLIKDLKFQLATPLTHLFNLSITTGTFPSNLKTSRTIPIFKAGNPLLCDNYRPISLLSSLSKILEKIISIKLVNHLEINHLLHDHQYGFQRNKSTVHHLLHLTNHIAEEQNKKNFALGSFWT